VNLSILPTCGTKFFQYKRRLEEALFGRFHPDEKEKIISSLKKAVAEAGFKVRKGLGRSD
jgi:phosphomannomutase